MCGLAGLYHLDGAPADPVRLGAMARLQAHRGPDDSGLRLFSLRSGVTAEPATSGGGPMEGGFAFNRLSIRDLSSAGHQPMVDPGGGTVLVFNGEIYNADELRDALRAEGAVFRSATDTEVILHGCRHWGPDRLLRRLNGMFVFAVADLAAGRLVIARDRFGIKPLYWRADGRRIAFASEIKAFFALPEFDAAPDEGRVDEFLMFRFCAGAATLLRGVSQLEPGCLLDIRPSGLRVERYWIPPVRTPAGAMRAEDARERVAAALDAAVRRQLVADVPLGTQLSGGIDSSLVAALAAGARQGPMAAYSVVFSEQEFSEERWSAEVAERHGLEQHRILLPPDSLSEDLGRAVWHMDQPLGHPNALGILRLAREARKDVAVLLSGEGADEIFAGYHRYIYAHWGGRLRFALPLLTRLPSVGATFERRFGADPRLDVPGRFILSQAAVRPGSLRRLRPQARIGETLAERRALFGDTGTALVDRCLAYDMRLSLPDMLVRQDKMTMAHSVENRVPFLDNALVDLAWSLPLDQLVRPGLGIDPGAARASKIVLKRIAERRFGSAFAYRPKSGFGLPLRAWLPGASTLWRETALPALRASGAVDADAAASLFDRPGSWTGADVETLWVALSLGTWLGTYAEKGREAARRALVASAA